MTPQEKLHAVETAIRKVLPKLMELSEGVILKRKEPSELYSDYVILKIKREDYSTYVEIDGKHEGSFSIKNEELLDCFEVIGHDILLSDVLEWFDKLYFNINEPVSLSNEVLIEQGIISIISLWCLSKTRLADQSEELINFLYNLIKE